MSNALSSKHCRYRGISSIDLRSGQPIPPSEPIRRAKHSFAAAIQNVRINHGSAYISMAEQLLNGANVVAVFQQMRCKRMAERVRAGWLFTAEFRTASFTAFCSTDS
jgi:hypothetical protein